MFTVIIILTGIALGLGILIYVVNRTVPTKVQGIEKTEEIAGILPGINCGACGHPGCFAYAQALTKDAGLILKTPCTIACQDPESLERLEKALGVTLDASEMSRKALIHCNGNSEVIYNYSGVGTCKAATQLLRGYKKCPYACLGLGDCLEVCPQDAISIKLENGVVIVDPEKCTGCGLCLAECPQNLIELVPAGTKIAFLCNYAPLKDIPGREKCDAGCIHCRKCFKSCEDEAIVWNKERAIPEFDIEKCTLCRKCIEVCPTHTLADFTEVAAKTKTRAMVR
ncbi:Na(+)-translocating ferredoxin:NAD(+) oxidoreductase complex subunit B [subsurface metagenome]